MTSKEVLMENSGLLENYAVVGFDENGKALDKPCQGYAYYKSIKGRLELHYECSHESIIDRIVENLNQPAAEDMKIKTMNMIRKLCSKYLATGRELVSFNFNLDQIDYDVINYFCKQGLLFYIWDPNSMPLAKSHFSHRVLEAVMSLDHLEYRISTDNRTSIELIFSSSLLDELLQKLTLPALAINDDKDPALEFSYDFKCNKILVRNLKKQDQEFLIKGLESGSKQALMAADLFNGKEVHGLRTRNGGSFLYNSVRKLNQYFNLNPKLFKKICLKEITSNGIKYALEKRSITLAEIKNCPKRSDGYLITNQSKNRDSNIILVFDDKKMSLLQVVMESEKAL
jgi:hypothetical protein